MREKFIAVTVAAIFSVVLAGSAIAEDVNVYMATSPDNNVKIAKFIKDKTGITVNQTFQSCGEVEAKMKAEAPNFSAEMVIGACSPQGYLAKRSGWSYPYVSPAWKDVPELFVDPKGEFYHMATFSFVLVGNKDRLAKAGYKMPESWKDLLDPKWKGEIVMPSPLSSGTANMMRFTFLALYGDTEGWKFIEALDKNIHHYSRSGNAPTDLVGRGEFILGITSDENVKKRIDDGYPLIWSIPKEGTGYDGTTCFIFKNTKKLEACKKIIDALGTQEFSDMMAGIGYVTPRPAKNALYGTTLPKFVKLDLGKAADEKDKNNDIWKQKLRTEFK